MATVQTTKGMMDEVLLERRDGVDVNPNEDVEWTEYWLEGELVHRSCHVKLRDGLTFGLGETGVLGG